LSAEGFYFSFFTNVFTKLICYKIAPIFFLLE